jgi:hypothetical protein
VVGLNDPPILLRVIVGFVDCAVKINHTSGEFALPQNVLIPAVAVDGSVAPRKELVKLVQAVPELSVIGVAQLSLDGAWAKTVSGKRKTSNTPTTQQVRVNNGFISGFD